MVNQKAVEFALFLTESSLQSLRRRSGAQYYGFLAIRRALVDALPDTSVEKIRVLAIIEKEMARISSTGGGDLPWDD